MDYSSYEHIVDAKTIVPKQWFQGISFDGEIVVGFWWSESLSRKKQLNNQVICSFYHQLMIFGSRGMLQDDTSVACPTGLFVEVNEELGQVIVRIWKDTEPS